MRIHCQQQTVTIVTVTTYNTNDGEDIVTIFKLLIINIKYINKNNKYKL